MQIKFLLALSALTGYVVADNCPAKYVMDRCLQDRDLGVKACGNTDYGCLCKAHQAKLQCYEQCPNDPGKGTEESEVSAWCVAAGGGSTTSSIIAVATSTSSGSSPSSSGSNNVAPTGASTPTSKGTASSTKTTTATTSGSTSNAGSAVAANLALAGAAGLAAILF